MSNDHSHRDIEFHAKIAGIYDYVTNQPRRVSNDLLFHPMDRQIGGGDLHLDLGCGTGQMLCRYAARFKQAQGVDHSPAMLDVARKNLQSAGIAHADLLEDDIDHFIDHNQSLQADLITCVGVLHHLQPDGIISLLQRLQGMIGPNGHILIAEPVEAPAPPALVQRWNNHSLVPRRVVETGFDQHEEPDEAPLALADLQQAVEQAGLNTRISSRGIELFQQQDPPGSVEKTMIRILQKCYGGRGNIVAMLLSKS